METSRDAQAQAGLTLYFLGKTHAGLRKLSAYYRQRGFQVSNVIEPAELARVVEEHPPVVALIDLQSRNDVSEFMDALAALPGSRGVPTVAIISSTTDAETADELRRRCDDSVAWPLKATDLSTLLFQLIVSRSRGLDIEADPRDPDGSLFRGRIHRGLLRPLLQLLYLSRQDGVVTMESEGRRGNLWFKDGKLIDAQVGALDWEESLDLIRRFTAGTFAISFQGVERRKFIERGALQWLGEREKAEAAAQKAEEEDGDVALLSFIDADDEERDDVDAQGMVDAIDSHDESEAFEITRSTDPFRPGKGDDDDEDDDQEPPSGRTIPALKAVRDADSRRLQADDDEEDDEDEDEEDYEDEDEDDEEEDEDYEDEDEDDYDDEKESTVARVSIRIGRVSREELERQMRLDSLGIDDLPFSGTRVSPAPPSNTDVVPTAPRRAPATPEAPVLTIAAQEAPGVHDAPESRPPSRPPAYPWASPPGSIEEIETVAVGSVEEEDDDDGIEAAIAAAAAAVDAPLEPTNPGITPAPYDLTLEPTQPGTSGAPYEAPHRVEPPRVEPPRADIPPVAPPPVVPPAPVAKAEPPAAPPPPRVQAPPKAPVAAPPPRPPAGATAAYPKSSPSRPPTPVTPPSEEGQDRRWVIALIAIPLVLLFLWFNPFKGDQTPEGPKPIATNGGDGDPSIRPVGPPIKPINPVEPTPRPAIIPPVQTPAPTPAPRPVAVLPPPTPEPARPTPVPHRATPKPPPVVVVSRPPKATPPPPKPTPRPAPAVVEPPQAVDVDTAEALAKALGDARAAEGAGDLKKALVLYARAVDMDKASAEAKDGVERVKGKLEGPQAKVGELFINSLPYGLVYIDGEKVGYTPVHRKDAVPREYVIRITNPDYGACSTVREVRPGERTFVYLKLDDDEACNRSSSSP